MKIHHIEMSLKTAYERFHEEDYHKLFDGAYFTVEEANQCRGVSATCDIAINNNASGNFDIVYEDGSVERGFFYQ